MVKSYINKKLKSNSFESKEPTQEHLGKNNYLKYITKEIKQN